MADTDYTDNVTPIPAAWLDDVNRLNYTIFANAANLAAARTALGVSIGPFHAHKNGTDQTGIATSTFTKLTWNLEEFDVSGYFGAGGCIPLVAGKYLLNWRALCETNLPTNTLFFSTLYKNGVRYKDGSISTSAGNALGGTSSEGVVVVDANGSTDAFELYVFQTTGGNVVVSGDSVETYFSGARVG